MFEIVILTGPVPLDGRIHSKTNVCKFPIPSESEYGSLIALIRPLNSILTVEFEKFAVVCEIDQRGKMVSLGTKPRGGHITNPSSSRVVKASLSFELTTKRAFE